MPQPSSIRVARRHLISDHGKVAGLFSWSCMACDKSLLSDMAAKGQDFAWMSQVVIAPRDYPLIVGEYDGYGRVLGPTGQVDEIIDLEYNGSGFSAWHRRCWERVGRPKHYKGQAPAAKDQGWFFDDEDYKGTEPGR